MKFVKKMPVAPSSRWLISVLKSPNTAGKNKITVTQI